MLSITLSQSRYIVGIRIISIPVRNYPKLWFLIYFVCSDTSDLKWKYDTIFFNGMKKYRAVCFNGMILSKLYYSSLVPLSPITVKILYIPRHFAFQLPCSPFPIALPTKSKFRIQELDGFVRATGVARFGEEAMCRGVGRWQATFFFLTTLNNDSWILLVSPDQIASTAWEIPSILLGSTKMNGD